MWGGEVADGEEDGGGEGGYEGGCGCEGAGGCGGEVGVFAVREWSDRGKKKMGIWNLRLLSIRIGIESLLGKHGPENGFSTYLLFFRFH